MSQSATAQAIAVPWNDPLSRYAFAFAFLSSAAAMVSIAVSHTCLVVALLLLIFSKTPLRVPRVVWPFGAFLIWTAASAAESGDWIAALPQFKKFFVFTVLIVVFSTFRTIEQARRLAEAWFACALAASLWSFVQFAEKWMAAHRAGVDFYDAYTPDRITGFFSHWMTFSQALMLVFFLLVSYLMFSEGARRTGRGIWLAAALICGLSLVLTYTRSVWIGVLVGFSYLVWQWRRKLLLAIPVALAVIIVISPGAARQRLQSIANPGPTEARLIMWRTGARMIAAYPWFGVGPERVGPRFAEFAPKDAGPLPDAYYGHLHNIYIHYSAERGLPSVAFLLWFFVLALWDFARALRRPSLAGRDDQRFLLQAAIACTIGIMVVGCFDVTLGDSEVLGIYLALIALGYRAVEVGRRQEAENNKVGSGVDSAPNALRSQNFASSESMP